MAGIRTNTITRSIDILEGQLICGEGGDSGSPSGFDISDKNLIVVTPTGVATSYYNLSGMLVGQEITVLNTSDNFTSVNLNINGEVDFSISANYADKFVRYGSASGEIL